MNPFATMNARNTKSAAAERLMETLGFLAESAAKVLQGDRSTPALVPAGSQGRLEELQGGALTCLLGTLRMGRKERSAVKQSVEVLLGVMAGASVVAPEVLMDTYKTASSAVMGALAEDSAETPFDYLRAMGLCD